MTVVKVQVPLHPPGGPWLIYAQHKTGMKFMAADKVPKKVREAMKDRFVGYFEAEYRDGAWMLGRPVEDPKWK